ncbi:hypothetical protein ACFTZ8_35150 [Streptomyces fungicidicus]|uniref:hypothetical protein n=1 Tax=Streptomyces fungicidicus TaxID=68203 RepID=UPI003639F806
MKITIECADPAPPEIVAAVTDLMARLGPPTAVTTDPGWTVDRAVKLLRDTNARTVLLVEAAVAGNGWVDGPSFREQWGENAFRGPTQSLTKAIKRGAEQGHWPSDIVPPFTPTTPDKAGWSKTGGYYLGEGLVPVFAEALKVLREKETTA